MPAPARQSPLPALSGELPSQKAARLERLLAPNGGADAEEGSAVASVASVGFEAGMTPPRGPDAALRGGAYPAPPPPDLAGPFARALSASDPNTAQCADQNAAPGGAPAARALVPLPAPSLPAADPFAPPPASRAASRAAHPPARPARARARHWGAALSFALCVLAPLLLSAWYLWTRAADQYASTLAFSVRQEETSNPLELLSGISALSGSSSPDTDVLYDFLGSQRLVAEIDAALDLRAIWERPGDPVFALAPGGAIEDLVAHWERKVRVEYGAGSGLLEVRVLAFAPEDAHRIAQAIYVHAQEMINALSALAREDALGYARLELSEAETRLSAARAALTAFRSAHRIIDPGIDLQGKAALLTSLETELAEAEIALALAQGGAGVTSKAARVAEAERRVAVLAARLARERAGFGALPTQDRAAPVPGSVADPVVDQATDQTTDQTTGQATGQTMGQTMDQAINRGGVVTADLVGDYERLAVEQEFAQDAYALARAAFDAARAEVRRQTRYLAAHIEPTRAETARYPERVTLLGLVALFALLGWAVLMLIAYAMRDRR